MYAAVYCSSAANLNCLKKEDLDGTKVLKREQMVLREQMLRSAGGALALRWRREF